MLWPLKNKCPSITFPFRFFFCHPLSLSLSLSVWVKFRSLIIKSKSHSLFAWSLPLSVCSCLFLLLEPVYYALVRKSVLASFGPFVHTFPDQFLCDDKLRQRKWSQYNPCFPSRVCVCEGGGGARKWYESVEKPDNVSRPLKRSFSLNKNSPPPSRFSAPRWPLW